MRYGVRRAVWVMVLGILATATSASAVRAGDPPADARKILFAVAADTPKPLRDLVSQWVEKPDAVPALRAILDGGDAPGGVERVDAAAFARPDRLDIRHPEFVRLAYHHLVLVGRAHADPLLRQASGWSATLDTDPPAFRAEGYGEFTGGVGLVESGPNPWLHSQAVDQCPYETLLFRVTGTTDAAVLAAARAFEAGLLNGVVPAADARRARATLLDLNPSVDACPLPIPDRLALAESHTPGAPDPAAADATPSFAARYMGWTQASAHEYRAQLDVAGHEPSAIWRLKWLGAGVLQRMTRDTWWNGPHRMASGNALVAARFATDADARATADAMKRFGWTPWEADGLRGWLGKPTPNLSENNNRPLYAVARGPWLFLSGLPADTTATLVQTLVSEK